MLLPLNEGNDAMTNSDVSLLRIVERFQGKKKKKLRKVYFCTSVWKSGHRTGKRP